MWVQIINEYGLDEALLGLGLSFGKTSNFSSPLPNGLRLSMYERATRLAGLGKGHDKFLRAITVTLDIQAPLYFWSEFDTYKVGTVAQSESKMHTLLKTPLSQECFEEPIWFRLLNLLEDLRQQGCFDTLLNNLPMSFLQRRIVTCNYAVLRNIYIQRNQHKLPQWHEFCRYLYENLKYPELFEFGEGKGEQRSV
ncbi:hypothetical protein KUD97_07845 [Desulfovibrio desulfuricans]|uniref:Uncharacterized protein n=1 Tax=Desulfovibrio phage ProddE TaxID=2866661 RepID=A0AAE8XAN5_9CAUD|nr:hypothetical protein [Desulfovibrio desulfuricans]UAJ16894.1 hypothetical protein CPT_ProddE_014 [Desulfovibrio phage ProddE]UIA98904.1 hypothetical protein KUD97_07845 [Desulfovibrio desulfuricans]